jgi:hypothetical protein
MANITEHYFQSRTNTRMYGRPGVKATKIATNIPRRADGQVEYFLRQNDCFSYHDGLQTPNLEVRVWVQVKVRAVVEGLADVRGQGPLVRQSNDRIIRELVNVCRRCVDGKILGEEIRIAAHFEQSPGLRWYGQPVDGVLGGHIEGEQIDKKPVRLEWSTSSGMDWSQVSVFGNDV